VEIDNTKGTSDLVLTGQSAAYGTYVVGPPSWIPQGTVGRLVVQDPKPSVFGSQGTVTYDYCDANLAMSTVTFSYECPTGFNDNKAASTQAAWACFAKSSNANNAWSRAVPGGGHPLYVDYVTAGGRPRPPTGGERIVTGARNEGRRVGALCQAGATWSPRSVAQVVADLRRGDHRYVAVDAAGRRSEIVVVRGAHGPYLRTKPDASAQNNLRKLPKC
jgi:hypothetical protein